MEQLLEALHTGAGMLWKALWGLAFGYVISAAIQVLVTRERTIHRSSLWCRTR